MPWVVMKSQRANIYRTKSRFKVLQTTKHSQTAVMTLGPGQSSGEEPEAHQGSEQTLLVVEGELQALIAGKRSRMKNGDVVVIPAKTKHKFTNLGSDPAVTINVYCPPEYPPYEAG
jgi:mannose-6-phosphate isomerase-like protein (cupin superfamily)